MLVGWVLDLSVVDGMVLDLSKCWCDVFYAYQLLVGWVLCLSVIGGMVVDL